MTNLVKRHEPPPIFVGLPCSAVSVGCALGIEQKSDVRFPSGLEGNYLSLANMNRFVRSCMDVTERCYFRPGHRPALLDFLRSNTRRCIICVLGHYLYADGRTYWSFLRNGHDPVVSVWYLS